MKRILVITVVFCLIGVLTGTAQEVLNDPPGFEKSSTANDKMQRAWLWSEGTKFTGTMLVFTSDSKIEIKPSKEKLHIYAKKYDSHWVNPSFFFGFKPKAAAYIRTEKGHGAFLIETMALGADVSTVDFKFENLVVNGSEMTGTCTFSISYGFKGDKELKELKGDNVPVKFTSSNLPTKSNLPVKLATPPTQSKPWLRGIDCSNPEVDGQPTSTIFPQTLAPDKKGGYENIVKEMLQKYSGMSMKEQYRSALLDVMRQRKEMWVNTGTYSQELVNADHFFVAFNNNMWTNNVIHSYSVSRPGIIGYDIIKALYHIGGTTYGEQHLCNAPESPFSLSAIAAGLVGRSQAVKAKTQAVEAKNNKIYP